MTMAPVNAKSSSPFVKLLEQGYGISHSTIHPATPRFNGSVENFHTRIQNKLYALEPFLSEKDLAKAFKISPQRLKTKWLKGLSLVFLPPIILDKLPLYPQQFLHPRIASQSREVLPDHFKSRRLERLASWPP